MAEPLLRSPRSGWHLPRIGWHLGAAAALLGFLTISACGERPARIALGEPAPGLSLPALDGARVDSRELAGRPVLINFWATWCGPCRREVPELAALAREGRAEVLAVALDEAGAAAVGPFAERLDLPYTVLLGGREDFERFRGLTIPYSLLLDPEQRIAAIYRGPIDRRTLEADLALLSAAGGSEA